MKEFFSLTLPIKTENGLHMSQSEAKFLGNELAVPYNNANPDPYIVIDNFLPDELIESIYESFPENSNVGDKVFDKGYSGLHKRQISPWDCDPKLQSIFSFFNSAPMLQFLEGLTGIDGLISDPYFNGGGLHETKKGGLLGMHKDFRVNKTLHLARRLNVIIYLNKNWKDEYGGHLEIWDKSMKQKVLQVSPLFNRCVIFNTDVESYHGHPDPLNAPENISRRSVALYYYTASKRIYEEIPGFNTQYAARPFDDSKVKRIVAKSQFRNYRKHFLDYLIKKYSAFFRK